MKVIATLLAMTVGLFPLTPFSDAADGALPPLSLLPLLEELRRANPDLLSARKRWEAAQAKIPLAKGLPAPKIGVKWEEIPRGTFKVNQATLMYQLIQSLPFPGKLSLRHQVAVKEAQVAAMMFKQVEWDVTGQLKNAYYDLFLLDRELEIQKEQIVWLTQAEGIAQARYSTGMTNQAEVLRTQGEVLEASNQRDVLIHRRQALVAHLNHLLNRPSMDPVGNPGPISLLSVPSDPEELMAVAQDNQSELLAFRFSAERADSAWQLSKRELWPDLETLVELRDPAMGPIGPWDLSLALVLPFWFWTKQQYGVKVALHDKESAQAAHQAMKNEVSNRIHEHWHEAKAAFLTAQLCQEGLIPLARQAVSSALAAYQSGRGSSMELLEALRALSQRQRTYYEHLVLLEQRMVMLEQAVGVPLRQVHEDRSPFDKLRVTGHGEPVEP